MLIGAAARQYYPSIGVNFTNAALSIAAQTLVSPQQCTVLLYAMKTVSGDGQALTAIGGDAVGGPANSLLALLHFGGTMGIQSNDNNSGVIGSMNQNQWYACAMTGNGNTATGYLISGSLAIQKGTSPTIVAGSPQTISFSNDDENDGNWQGVLKYAQVLNYPMTEAEILRQVQQGAPLQAYGVQSYLPFRSVGSMGVDEFNPGRIWTKTGTPAAPTVTQPPVPEIRHKKSLVYVSNLDSMFYAANA